MAHFSALCHREEMTATVTLGNQGRLVIPAAVRTQLGVQPGDELDVRVEGASLVLTKRSAAAAGLRGYLRDEGLQRSLVEELLAERRAEAS